MPIDVRCPNCSKAFRAPDEYAGRRVKCPGCKEPLKVPQATEPAKASNPQRAAQVKGSATAAASSTAPTRGAARRPVKVSAAEQWHVQTSDGEQYGPISRDELDSWVADGRLDHECQLLCDGWDQWKWADEVYPELGAESEASGSDASDQANPFAGVAQAVVQTKDEVGYALASSDDNPFAAPRATKVSAEPSEELITPALHRTMAETRPWVMFLSILGFVVSGLMTLSFGIVTVTMLLWDTVAAAFPVLLATAGAVLQIVVSYYLFSYARRIGGFLRTNKVKHFQAAMVAQKSFWKLVGVMTVAMLVLYFVSSLLAYLAINARIHSIST